VLKPHPLLSGQAADKSDSTQESLDLRTSLLSINGSVMLQQVWLKDSSGAVGLAVAESATRIMQILLEAATRSC